MLQRGGYAALSNLCSERGVIARKQNGIERPTWENWQTTCSQN
jgi:hypothetical protein